MTIYTSTNIQTIHKIYLEIHQSKRISDTSSNEGIFNNHNPIYQQTLKNSDFNNNYIYRKSQHPSKTKKAQM